jgi:hypothetical protein
MAGSEPSMSSILRQVSRALRTFDAGWQLGAWKASLDGRLRQAEADPKPSSAWSD